MLIENSDEIERTITTDSHAVHRVGSKTGVAAIGSGHGEWTRNGIAKWECREFSSYAGQRRRPVCRSANSSTVRRIVSLLVRSLGGISRGGDRATRGIWDSDDDRRRAGSSFQPCVSSLEYSGTIQ